jgi:hypothetical protein
MRKIVFLLVFVGAINTLVFAQKKIIVTAEQVRLKNKNVELIGKPVILTHTYEIERIEGDTNGFWIENSKGNIIKSFSKSNQAVGFRLGHGLYKFYPNLLPGHTKAYIKVILRPVGLKP